MSNHNALQFQEYSEEYKQIIKQYWYSQGRPSILKLQKTLPKDEFGRVPNAVVIGRWKDKELWDFWADELDSRVMAKVEDELIAQKAEMLKRHANMAWDLQKQAVAYLKEEGFDSSSSAVAAILKGAELERVSRGIGEMIVKMAQMDDGALKDEIMKYINRASENDQIVDAEEVPEQKEEIPEE